MNVYVIEDGQNKETISWLKRNEWITTIYHQENKGVAPSWNDGIRMALNHNCTHLAFINDDIELCPGWGGVCNLHVDMISLAQPSPYPLTGWFFILTKKCIDRVGLFDEQFAPFCGEDDDYWFRFRYSGLKYARVDLDIKHQGSGTISKIDRKKYKEIRRANWQRLRDKYPNERLTLQDY